MQTFQCAKRFWNAATNLVWENKQSNTVIFLGNCGIVPVSWFELRLSTRKAMSLKCAGKVPLNLLLLEMSIFVARENVRQNESGILSIRANCCWSQSGNRGPIWQDAKCAFRSLKGGNQSAFTTTFKLLEAMFKFFKLIKPAKCSTAKAIEAATLFPFCQLGICPDIAQKDLIVLFIVCTCWRLEKDRTNWGQTGQYQWVLHYP